MIRRGKDTQMGNTKTFFILFMLYVSLVFPWMLVIDSDTNPASLVNQIKVPVFMIYFVCLFFFAMFLFRKVFAYKRIYTRVQSNRLNPAFLGGNLHFMKQSLFFSFLIFAPIIIMMIFIIFLS